MALDRKKVLEELDKIKKEIEDDKVDSIVMAYRKENSVIKLASGNEIDIFGLTGELMSGISASKQERKNQASFKDFLDMLVDGKEDN